MGQDVLSIGTLALDQVRVDVVGVRGCTARQQDAGMIVGVDIAVPVVFPVIQCLGRLQRVMSVSGLLVAAPLQVLRKADGGEGMEGDGIPGRSGGE